MCWINFTVVLIQTSPFSEVILLLSKDLRLTSEQNLLLSHKTATLMPTESPLSRSLTTADIIGKVLTMECSLKIRAIFLSAGDELHVSSSDLIAMEELRLQCALLGNLLLLKTLYQHYLRCFRP